MTDINSNKYALEDRTLNFAKNVTLFCKQLQRTISNMEYAKQVIRSSGSIGANYIEANEALSKKDFVMRIKICRKEAKETTYWLKLTQDTNKNISKNNLLSEAIELKKIFSAILLKQSQ